MASLAVKSVLISHGVEMPLFGLGTFKITAADAVFRALEEALATGYRLVDTASMYNNEKEIGDALKTLMPKFNLTRKEIFITTKTPFSQLGKNETRELFAESLAKLQTDYVDLLLIHYPGKSLQSNSIENAKLRQETWTEMEKFLEEGKAKAIGVSNYEIKHLEEMRSYAKIMPAVNQCEFHPHFTRLPLVSYCQDNKIHFQAYTSLGRYHPDLMNEPVLQEIASAHNANVPQILLAWAMGLGVSVLPKSATPERIRENVKSATIILSDEESAKISALNRDKPYTLCTPWLVS